ncbi:hypothetical protein OG339_48120 (plasmid) [Streptosporangium sp. NBC_01495]|uniref:hypothetical protein n=1 Tax=Streptosporangium sp. NBC_01495 TaxID=2903899 RepID=UPI002E3062E7|nr:hypothetical protein [Streptosporangium sp. NBC_01495]
MIPFPSEESDAFSTSGDLSKVVAVIAADGVFAQPVVITGDQGAQAVVISMEHMEILRQALDDVSDARPLSEEQLASSLGLVIASDGTLRVSDG